MSASKQLILVLASLAVGCASGHFSSNNNLRIGIPLLTPNFQINARSAVSVDDNNVVGQLVKTISRIPATLNVESEYSTKVINEIAAANSSARLSQDTVSIDGQYIRVAKVMPKTVDRDAPEVGKTLVSFADELKYVTDEEACDCDPKDSSRSVRDVIDATSKICQDLLRCLLDSLKPTIKQREAILIRVIVRENMNALSKSVDGIYSIWRTDKEQRNLNSVQTVVNGLIDVLGKLANRLTQALSADTDSRMQTVAYVVDTLLNLVANTSDAIASDVDTGLDEQQLQQVMSLATDLAEPLTSSVLAEFVQGTARIPYINKLLLQFIIKSYNMSNDCSHSKEFRAQLPSQVLRALAKGLRAHNLKIATVNNLSAIGSQANRNATTGFLLSIISQGEGILKGISKLGKNNDACVRHMGESVANIAEIVKSVIDNVANDVKEPKQRQQTTLAGQLSKDFVDIISVIGSNMALKGNSVPVANITYLIYQQYDVLRRVAKNDQAISRDSPAGVQSTISLLVDIARLEIRYVQINADRIRHSRDSSLRFKTVRDINLRIIESMVTVGRTLAPANNRPLIDLIKGGGSALAEVSNILEDTMSKKPRTFGDLLYEVFYSLLETQRKLVNTGSQPSRSGLPTTVPTDVIYGTVNTIRTTIDWANALTRTSGLDGNVQKSLISYVIQVIMSVEQSLTDNEKSNSNIDDSVRSELAQIKNQLQEIFKNGLSATTTQSYIDYYDYSDNSDKSVSSGVSELVNIIQQLDDLLNYIIESSLKQPTSIVLRNSETIIHVIIVLLDDVSRTPEVNEDGSINLPSGTLKPCTGKDTTNTGTSSGGGVSTTPMPASPETKPPQTTTTVAPTKSGRDGEGESGSGGRHHTRGPSGSTGKPDESGPTTSGSSGADENSGVVGSNGPRRHTGKPETSASTQSPSGSDDASETKGPRGPRHHTGEQGTSGTSDSDDGSSSTGSRRSRHHTGKPGSGVSTEAPTESSTTDSSSGVTRPSHPRHHTGQPEQSGSTSGTSDTDGSSSSMGPHHPRHQTGKPESGAPSTETPSGSEGSSGTEGTHGRRHRTGKPESGTSTEAPNGSSGSDENSGATEPHGPRHHTGKPEGGVSTETPSGADGSPRDHTGRPGQSGTSDSDDSSSSTGSRRSRHHTGKPMSGSPTEAPNGSSTTDGNSGVTRPSHPRHHTGGPGQSGSTSGTSDTDGSSSSMGPHHPRHQTGKPSSSDSTQAPSGSDETSGTKGPHGRKHHTGRSGESRSTSEISDSESGSSSTGSRRPRHHTGKPESGASTEGPTGSSSPTDGSGVTVPHHPRHHTGKPGSGASTGAPSGSSSSDANSGATGPHGLRHHSGKPGSGASTEGPAGSSSPTDGSGVTMPQHPRHHTGKPGSGASTETPSGSDGSSGTGGPHGPRHHTGRPESGMSTESPSGSSSPADGSGVTRPSHPRRHTGKPEQSASTIDGAGNPTTSSPNQTTRASSPFDARDGSCKQSSLDDLINYLLRETNLNQQDLAQLEKILEDLLNKSTSQSCTLKTTTTNSSVPKRLLADVVQSIVVRRQAICA